jgi:predicted transcriptional regulator
MVRTQVQLDEDQYARLKELAARRSQSISQLVREGVDQFLTTANRSEVWERLMNAAGSCHDPEGKTDVSRRHDEYLAAAYRK